MYGTGFGPFGYRLTPWVKRLIIANTVVFLLNWSGAISLDWLSAHLGFRASEAWREPWTIVTYMFVHGGFLHLLFNMLMLFFFGVALEDRW
jgi:membrane associated rhomboid family serine protease